MTVGASHLPWSAADGPSAAARPADGALARMRRVVEAQRDLAAAPADPAVVFQVLADCVLSICDAEGSVASQPEGDAVVARATAGATGPAPGHRLPRRGSLAGLALSTLAGQLCRDALTDGRTDGNASVGIGARSSIIVPLVHDGVAIGVIGALSSRPDTFDQDDLDLLTMLAEVATSRLLAAFTEADRKRLEARNAAVIEAMADGLLLQDLDGTIVLANSAAGRVLGLTSGQLHGRSSLDPAWRALWDDGTVRPGHLHPSMLTLASGEPRRDDVMGVHTPAGELRWLLVNAHPVRDRDGALTGVVTSFSDVTARRTLEGARDAREARLRAAHALTGLGWWELDLVTEKHVWSDAMFRLVGLEPSDEPPSFNRFLSIIHPDDRAAAIELRARGFGTGNRELFRVVHPDGTVRWLQSWTETQHDEDGEMVRVLGATIDVTEREEALESLAVSRARLAASIELTQTATWEWDVATGLLTWSDRMVELMGHDVAAGQPRIEDFTAKLHPDDRPRMQALSERTLATGVAEEAVYRVVHPDGSVRHVRAWTDVRRNKDGVVTHLWGTGMDITEQEEYSARLVASEEHFRVAFENAPIGMSMISLRPEDRGTYLATNPAFQRMLGRTHEGIRGMPIEELTHPDDRERDVERFGQLVRGEETTTAFEKRYLHADGRIVHAWLTSSVVHGPKGEVRYLVTHAVDISDRLREQAELERLALTDTLTGLANRTLLNDRLDQGLARLHRTGGAMAMLLLDVDRFKTVNDSLGHQVGDALLVQVASRIESVSRADTTVARLGGDEFVVLVEGLPTADAVHAVAGRVLRSMRRPFDLGPSAEALVATVSIGVSVADDATRTPGDLYREADLALYRAKDAGRDQYALFDDELRARADQRLTAERMLRRALADSLLVPVFQPIIDLSDGAIHAAEALVRIQDGDRLVLPAEFIDVAEETGLIVEIDARMFERVAAEAARLLESSLPLRRLATNVSARSLEDPSFVSRMQRALTWHGVPGSMIRVELTERSLLTASPKVRESLDRIQQLDLAIGLDDFGTGYSALAYLQEFPLQFLKIDRSFVSRLGTSARDDAVVNAVIDLAHAHELEVVAEGVETEEQLDALRRMGCDRAQGYLMGRPMRASELDELLRSGARW